MADIKERVSQSRAVCYGNVRQVETYFRREEMSRINFRVFLKLKLTKSYRIFTERRIFSCWEY